MKHIFYLIYRPLIACFYLGIFILSCSDNDINTKSEKMETNENKKNENFQNISDDDIRIAKRDSLLSIYKGKSIVTTKWF
jgi:hypothetical protein